MRSYQTLLGRRDQRERELKLTDDEARDMLAAGFQFAEFREETGEYRLTAPFKTAIDLAHGTVTIMQ